MTGYIVTGILCFLLGFYMGNKKFRRQIQRMIGGFREDYEEEDDELYGDNFDEDD